MPGSVNDDFYLVILINTATYADMDLDKSQYAMNQGVNIYPLLHLIGVIFRPFYIFFLIGSE